MTVVLLSASQVARNNTKGTRSGTASAQAAAALQKAMGMVSGGLGAHKRARERTDGRPDGRMGIKKVLHILVKLRFIKHYARIRYRYIYKYFPNNILVSLKL